VRQSALPRGSASVRPAAVSQSPLRLSGRLPGENVMSIYRAAHRALWRAGLVALLAAIPGAAALAQNMSFVINNGHEHRVQVELYSQDRDHVWPGNNQAFILDDDETKQIPISCRRGETVCYGAWVDGDPDTYWGVGPNDIDTCTDCCFVCKVGETEEVWLVP
jgi:hypothetical protein